VTLLRGAIGLAKARLGIDRASPKLIGLRRELCFHCPQRRGWFCARCQCLVAEKAKVLTEQCPLGLW
jgi:hypothetical protein